MERMVLDFGRMYQERNEALQEVARAHHDALLRLARAAEYRDDDTGVHIVRIGYLAWALALRLGQRSTFAACCCARPRRCTTSARSACPTPC